MPKRIFIKDGGLSASIPTPTGFTVIGADGGIPKKQVVSTISNLSGFTHYIGEHFGGGVIFNLWKENGIETGLIVDIIDLGTSVWSNVNNTLIGSSAQSSWDGLSNSNAIISQVGHTDSAAKLCLDSTNGGYTDWYLPSIDELSLVIQNRFNINYTLSSIGGATILPFLANYWSSTEKNTSNARVFDFNDSLMYNFGKDSDTNVRAIRKF